MRGPSSSHSAASLRIGRLARDLMGGELNEVIVDYDPNGSLVTTHDCQGSDLGLFGGLMGWETDDERLPSFREEIVKAGIKVEIRYVAYGAEHPNTYRLTNGWLYNTVHQVWHSPHEGWFWLGMLRAYYWPQHGGRYYFPEHDVYYEVQFERYWNPQLRHYYYPRTGQYVYPDQQFRY